MYSTAAVACSWCGWRQSGDVLCSYFAAVNALHVFHQQLVKLHNVEPHTGYGPTLAC
jgi:hypothetical protein